MHPVDTYVPAPPATIISPQLFSTYAQAWIEAASSDQYLAEAFQKSGCQRLTFASFDFQNVVWLVSTVGARQIKAQFVLVPEQRTADGEHAPAYFSVVLYAVDSLGGRISAYYLGSNVFTTVSEKPTAEAGYAAPDSSAKEDANSGSPVAFDLAKTWLTNWTNQKKISSELFTSNYGPLQGYTFELGDFMDPLFYSQKFGKTQELHVCFALHEYYAAFPKKNTPKLTSTFGVVLRFYGTVPLKGYDDKLVHAHSAVEEAGQPFYDLSTPNPPGFSNT